MSMHSQILTINSAITQLMRHVRVIDEKQGIGRARLSVLAVLRFGGEQTLSHLAESEMVSRATMHHVINGLEEEGLVWRQADPQDGRRQLVRLTTEGRKKIEVAHKARISYFKQLVVGLDMEDLRKTADTLDAMRNESWRHQ